MGVAEVVGFAACWLMVAALMLWGVFTEKKRGPMRVEPPAGAAGPWHPSRNSRTLPADWVVVEAAVGAGPDVADQARFLATAWLASRGIDIATVPPADIRTEVTTDGDGASTTRVLVRTAALQTSRRHR
jgi:hypothetical protein